MNNKSNTAILKKTANLPINTTSPNPQGSKLFKILYQDKESIYKQLDSTEIDKDLLLKAKARISVHLDRGTRKEIVDLSKHILNRIDPNANRPITPDIDLILVNYGQIGINKPQDIDKVIDCEPVKQLVNDTQEGK
jgi:hypothetical protein